MTYKSTPEITLIKRKIGNGSVTYRLLRSDSERGGRFILLSSDFDGAIEDAFIPYVAESDDEAEKIFRFLYENDVTPCTVYEILDDYFAIK